MTRKSKRLASGSGASALPKSTLEVPSIGSSRSSSLLALPVELQLKILFPVLTHFKNFKPKKKFPPKRHNQRWLKELKSLGVNISHDTPELQSGARPCRLNLNILLACRELYRLGNELFWSRNSFCFQDWRHLRDAWSIAHQRPNLSRIRHIIVRNILDHPGRLQVSGNMHEALAHLPRHHSITVGDLLDSPAMFRLHPPVRDALELLPRSHSVTVSDILDRETGERLQTLQKITKDLPPSHSIAVGDILDRPPMFQVPGCLYETLQHLPHLRSIKVRVGLFSKDMMKEVLHAAFHDMEKLPYLKFYMFDWRYTCWCRTHDRRDSRACMDILAMEPGRRTALLNDVWAEYPPYETWDDKEWNGMVDQMSGGDDMMDQFNIESGLQ